MRLVTRRDYWRAAVALVTLAILVACGHHELTTATRPIANTEAVPSRDAAIDASEANACLRFFAAFERAKACDLDAPTIVWYKTIAAELDASYQMDDPDRSAVRLALLRRCEDETAKLIGDVRVPCGW